MAKNSNTVAAALEVLPGFFIQTFGIGHIYQGRIGMGVFIMLSYWALQAINLLLCSIMIGFITTPLTWLFYMVAAPVNAVSRPG